MSEQGKSIVDLARLLNENLRKEVLENARLRAGIELAATSTHDEVVRRHLNALLKGEA